MSKLKYRISFRFITSFMIAALSLMTIGPLPASQAQVQTLPALTPPFEPCLMKGLNLHFDDPLKFDFIVDKGNTNLGGEAFKQESNKLVKYFLASLTVPEEDMWVNLSPYEKDRIVPDEFGQTEMGRDLLEQDYFLKQLTASLMSPEGELGKEFWEKVYSQAGTTDVPIDTFNKVWIVPEKATIYEHKTGAFVVSSHLKVMLEEDYNVSREASLVSRKEKMLHASRDTSDLIRQIILPALEKEVNEGQTFAPLRQVYNSMLLAAWYKKNLKESILGKVYVDQKKTEGIEISDRDANQKIYEQYLEAFKKGANDFIKEEYNPQTQQVIPKRYFSGGVKLNGEFAMFAGAEKKVYAAAQLAADSDVVSVDLAMNAGHEVKKGPSPVVESDSAVLSYQIDNESHVRDLLGTENFQKLKDVLSGRRNPDRVDGRNSYLLLESDEKPELKGKAIVIKGFTDKIKQVLNGEERVIRHSGLGRMDVHRFSDENGYLVVLPSFVGSPQGMMTMSQVETENEFNVHLAQVDPSIAVTPVGIIHLNNPELRYRNEPLGCVLTIIDDIRDIRGNGFSEHDLDIVRELAEAPFNFETDQFVNPEDQEKARRLKRIISQSMRALRVMQEAGIVHRFFSLNNLSIYGDSNIRVRDLSEAYNARKMTREQFREWLALEFQKLMIGLNMEEEFLKTKDRHLYHLIGRNWLLELILIYFGKEEKFEELKGYDINENDLFQKVIDAIVVQVSFEFGSGILVRGPLRNPFLSEIFNQDNIPYQVPDPIFLPEHGFPELPPERWVSGFDNFLMMGQYRELTTYAQQREKDIIAMARDGAEISWMDYDQYQRSNRIAQKQENILKKQERETGSFNRQLYEKYKARKKIIKFYRDHLMQKTRFLYNYIVALLVRKQDEKARTLYESHRAEIEHLEQVFLDDMRDAVVNGSSEEAKYIYDEKPLDLVNVDSAMSAKPQPAVNGQIVSGDRAMIGQKANSDLGGIDMNPNKVDFKTQSNGEKFEFPFNVNDLQNLPEVNGFTPVIFQIIPVNNIFQLLGLKEEKPQKPRLPNTA